MKRISVIIPLYNGEPFLADCLQSVLGQTYKNLEVLVIDDGSEDGGPALCREFARRDGRVALHTQEHRGVSAARNRGLALAAGEAVFFLDSDDAVHPLLLEECARQLEDHGAQLASCAYRRMEGRLLERPAWSPEDERPRWRRAQGEEAERWFHGPYTDPLSGIGGKLIRREVIGSLRFDEDLIQGEDTLFLYQLFRRGLRAAYGPRGWYYYRIHGGSATGSAARRGAAYSEAARRLRDLEWALGREAYVLKWERLALRQLEDSCLTLRAAGEREGLEKLRALARREVTQPLYRRLRWDERLLFRTCLLSGPLYRLERALFRLYGRGKRRLTLRSDVQTGILTFHCADNFGAMLQAYGLMTALLEEGIPAEIVAYEPPYMTGRHWLVPYVPGLWRRSPLRGAKYLLWRTWANLSQGRNFFRRRAAMRRFRRERLTGPDAPRLRTCLRFGRLPYACYVVGSDQIWNPEITFGLRRAYFGAFENPRKRRVAAYAASLGSASLPPEYAQEFADLLRHVDAVSVREEEALPYVGPLCRGEARALADPVFLLEREDWRQVERPPDREGYILFYATESHPEMTAYAQTLSRRTGLPVVEVSCGVPTPGTGFQADLTAGPAEFLGYVHRAAYVVTNSFHAVAFSILFQRPFLAFAHSRLNARVYNILRLHGLESRLCRPGREADIDAPVDWARAARRTRALAREGRAFLRENLPGPENRDEERRPENGTP